MIGKVGLKKSLIFNNRIVGFDRQFFLHSFGKSFLQSALHRTSVMTNVCKFTSSVTEEVNLQTFVIIQCKTIVITTSRCTKIDWLKKQKQKKNKNNKKTIFSFFPK